MTTEARMIGYELLKTGTLVSFRIVSEEVLNAPADEAEFGPEGEEAHATGRSVRQGSREDSSVKISTASGDVFKRIKLNLSLFALATKFIE
jgi:hypothetical protein